VYPRDEARGRQGNAAASARWPVRSPSFAFDLVAVLEHARELGDRNQVSARSPTASAASCQRRPPISPNRPIHADMNPAFALLGLVFVGVACNSDNGGSGSVDARLSGNVDAPLSSSGDARAGGSDASGGEDTVTTDWVSGTRLRARVQTTADGAKAFYGWYDSQLHTNCYNGWAADGQQRCLPATQAVVGGQYFSDAVCATKLATFPTAYAVCSPTIATLGEFETTCGEYGYPSYQQRFYALGAVFSGTVYERSGTTCIGDTNKTQYPYTGSTFYLVGAEMPPTSFAAFTVTTE
jgi:hypothetical protein